MRRPTAFFCFPFGDNYYYLKLKMHMLSCRPFSLLFYTSAWTSVLLWVQSYCVKDTPGVHERDFSPLLMCQLTFTTWIVYFLLRKCISAHVAQYLWPKQDVIKGTYKKVLLANWCYLHLWRKYNIPWNIS